MPTMRQPVDTRKLPQAHPEPWFVQTLASHNGANLKFRVMRGTVADFHVHADSPECFFVVSGQVTIDMDSHSVTLEPGQFMEVPAGVRHRSRVEGEATVLVFDGLAP
jgi:mannose-6-phosphate isomerase-like protein (cupin superfamily)